MDWPTIPYPKIRHLILGLLTLLLAMSGASAEDTWVTFSSANVARRMMIADDSLFVATSGGLLVTQPDAMLPGKIFTNLDGLGTTDLTDIILDAQGQKWVTGNGRLLKFDVRGSEQFLFQDNDNNLIRLQCLADDGNYIWVGCPTGLVLFNKTTDGGLIQDSYQMFGRLPASPSVTGIYIAGDSIWLATSAGIAVADKSDARLLKQASSWLSFNALSNPELAGAIPRRILIYNNQLLVATSNGLFRCDRSLADTIFTELNYNPTADFTDLRVERDTLFVYCSRGLGFMVGSSVLPLSTSGLPAAPSTGAGTGLNRWAAISNGGIYRTDAGQFQKYEYTGLPNNDIIDIAVGPSGMPSVAFFRNRRRVRRQCLGESVVQRRFLCDPPDYGFVRRAVGRTFWRRSVADWRRRAAPFRYHRDNASRQQRSRLQLHRDQRHGLQWSASVCLLLPVI